MPSSSSFRWIGLVLGALLGAVIGLLWEGGAGFGVGFAVGAALGLSAGTMADESSEPGMTSDAQLARYRASIDNIDRCRPRLWPGGRLVNPQTV